MTNGGGTGHHPKPKKKPASKKRSTPSKAKKWVPTQLTKSPKQGDMASQ